MGLDIAGARRTDMSPAFNGGVVENVHVKGKKLRHLRIKAGKQRDEYVHSIVFQAKILGRRESWEREHPDGQPIPDNEFYRYIDLTFETVDHDDQDSLNNDPLNLVRMTRGANAAKANRHGAAERKRKKTDKMERWDNEEKVPF